MIISPPEYLGNIMKLCDDRRGVQNKLSYLSKSRVLLEYDLPLNEVVLDFFDKLKSARAGTPRSTTTSRVPPRQAREDGSLDQR
jgi:translation elongation factor EF-4